MSKTYTIFDSPAEIWLEPQCADEGDDSRMWCQDDVWGVCDHCQSPPVKYIREDLVLKLRNAQ